MTLGSPKRMAGARWPSVIVGSTTACSAAGSGAHWHTASSWAISRSLTCSPIVVSCCQVSAESVRLMAKS